MMKHIPDVLLCAGALAVSFGAWMAWHPAGFIVFGAFLLVAGLKMAVNS